MKHQPKNKTQTLGIIGFGIEGQAIFEHYKDIFDQVYIFDEKLQDLRPVLDQMTIDSTVKISGFNFVTDSKIVDSGDKVIGATPSKLVVKLINNLNIPPEVDLLIKSPGIATYKVQLQNPKLKIQSLISLLFKKLDMSSVVAITGTKGKSTVSSLIAHILKLSGKKVELLGNIGNINIDLLDNYDLKTHYIFELSSFQCQQLTRSPHIAIWTNFYVDHQDVHQDMQEYYQAKANICRFQNKQDYFITIPELANVETKAQKIILKNSLFGKQLDTKGQLSTNQLQPNDPNYVSIKSFQTKLIGKHNQINCQFAFEACKLLGLYEGQIIEAITTFEPIKGRLEKVNEIIKNGNLIEFYTDDLATIPEATWQAILAFEGQVSTLITGGYDKGSDYTSLAKNLKTTNIKNIIYFDPTGQSIVSRVDPTKVNLHLAKSMQEAVNLAFKLTDQGICLLSCASASFGMFKNAYDRGEQYRQCIVRAKNQSTK